MTKPASSGEVVSPVHICLLGGFRVLKCGAPVAIRAGGKTESLLSSLAVQDHYRASREWLLEAIWPRSDPAHASTALTSLIHAIRKLLGDALAGAAPVVCASGGYQLNAAAGVTVDITQFEAFAGWAERDLRGGDAASALPNSLAAIALYRGDLCVIDGERVSGLVKRERLRALYLSMLGQVADQHFQHDRYRMALRYALRLLSQDPCREDAHRLVMRCHVRLGERAQAFRQYQICRHVLRSEFDVAPEPLTESLFDQVRTAPGLI